MSTLSAALYRGTRVFLAIGAGGLEAVVSFVGELEQCDFLPEATIW